MSNRNPKRTSFLVALVAAAASGCGGGGGEDPAPNPTAPSVSTPVTTPSTTRPVVDDASRRRARKQAILALIEGASPATDCFTPSPLSASVAVPGGGPIVFSASTGIATSALSSLDLLQRSSTFALDQNYADQTNGFAMTTGVSSDQPTFYMIGRSQGTSSLGLTLGQTTSVSCGIARPSLPDLSTLLRQIWTQSRVPMLRCTFGIGTSQAAADVLVEGTTVSVRGIGFNLAGAKTQERLSFRDSEGTSGALVYTAGFNDSRAVTIRVDDSGYLRSVIIAGGTAETTVTCDRPSN